MKKFYVDVREFDKDIVTTAIESGADALLANDKDIEAIKKLSSIKVIAKSGDIKLGCDIIEININNKEEEAKAMELVKNQKIIASIKDWKIIPLEDLIASNNENVFCYVKDSKEASTVLKLLEKGVAGIVLKTTSINTIKDVANVIKESSGKIELVKIKITETKPLGMADRVCIDTVTNMKPGEGMLVGDTSSGFFLVHSESLETPYCAPRPFRVNAGAVHAYIKTSNGKTKYLADLKTGDELLVCDKDGKTWETNLGRGKTEKRPMMLVKGEHNKKVVTLIMQNAETIRLVDKDGKAVSIVSLKKGDEVLGCIEEGGRHFGLKINETIIEK
jgi:3-dehydroquinate synthase II